MSNMQVSRNQQEKVLAFARQWIRVPGPSGNEGQIASLANQKMRAIGYDEVHVDSGSSVK